MINYLFYDNQPFPPHRHADKDGLLAVGGNLTVNRLIEAYSAGIFPWYNEEPVLWWSPDPRFVLYPEKIKISKSMKKILKDDIFEIRTDTDFTEVMIQCSKPRKKQRGTWINTSMINVYSLLHEKGIAHSVEVYRNGTLAGGLYGVSTGKVFSGESMFSIEDNASKAALISMAFVFRKYGFKLIDTQIHSPHLESLGAEYIPRKKYLEILSSSAEDTPSAECWKEMFLNFKTSAIFQ
ncbi:MAG: leucyl/phenylalanyl-tRNA--protein transferase [Spirochaetes bacterium]|nr:leucyl/phenylalanyl-tRNA--protein transferase [Spirochaetota bacterium]